SRAWVGPAMDEPVAFSRVGRTGDGRTGCLFARGLDRRWPNRLPFRAWAGPAMDEPVAFSRVGWTSPRGRPKLPSRPLLPAALSFGNRAAKPEGFVPFRLR